MKTFRWIGAFLAFALLVAGCGGAAGNSGGTAGGNSTPTGGSDKKIVLTYAGYGGALEEAEFAAWLKPYQDANQNVEFVYDATVSESKLISMVETGQVVWDIVHLGQNFGLAGHEKYLEKIDCSVVPCDDVQSSLFPTTGYRVAAVSTGVALGYNTELTPSGSQPENWSDFFDLDRFPGKRIVMKDMISFPLELALLADGVSPADLFPLDVERALGKLATIRDHLEVTESYQGCAESLAVGEAVMAACWTGRLMDVIDNGAPVEIQWNQNFLTAGYLFVPKGAPHKAEAMQALAWFLSPEPNARISDHITYGPVNMESDSYVNPERRPYLNSTYTDRAVVSNDEWWDQNVESVTIRWHEWLLGS